MCKQVCIHLQLSHSLKDLILSEVKSTPWCKGAPVLAYLSKRLENPCESINHYSSLSALLLVRLSLALHNTRNKCQETSRVLYSGNTDQLCILGYLPTKTQSFETKHTNNLVRPPLAF